MAVFTIGSSSVSGNNGGGDPPPSGGAVGGADNLTNNGAITQVSGAGVISESFVSQSGGTVTVEDTTAVSGDTKLIVKAGAGQSSNLQEWQDAAGTVSTAIGSSGLTFTMTDGTSTMSFGVDGDPYQLLSTATQQFTLLPTGLLSTTIAGGARAAYSIKSSTTTIQDDTATTGATLVDIVAGAAQTTKSVVLQTGGRIQAPLTTPTTSGETGTAGTIAWDANFIYICTSANTWKRVALAAF